MDGFDIQRYEQAKLKATELGMEIKLRGERVELINKENGTLLGVMLKVDELLSFLNGYEWGIHADSGRKVEG